MRKRRKLKRGKLWRVSELSVASQSRPSGHITADMRFAPLTQMPSVLRKHAESYMK